MSSSTEGFVGRWRARARRIRREVYALYLACRDPRVPWYAKLLAALIVAYALSPLDLIPDFIPVLGHLDDAILIPLGVLVVRAMIPDGVMAECRERAQALIDRDMPIGRLGAAIVVALWILLAVGGIWLAVRVSGA